MLQVEETEIQKEEEEEEEENFHLRRKHCEQKF
jgi:hypothetical protein